MMNKFYVYEHWRPDINMPFYVGKGSGNRAFRLKKNRNRHFRNIVSKLEKQGLCVEITHPPRLTTFLSRVESPITDARSAETPDTSNRLATAYL